MRGDRPGRNAIRRERERTAGDPDGQGRARGRAAPAEADKIEGRIGQVRLRPAVKGFRFGSNPGEPTMRVSLGLVAASLVALATSASAAPAGLKGTGVYGTAGCGLGSLVFGNQPGAVQILAATTNGTFASQTFGITTGTSNCGAGLIAQGTKNFVEANRETLAKDMSRGQGETIGALTVMAGCSDSRQVGATLQANFDRIFPSEQATSDDVAKALLDTLQADAALGCHI
jgi:hypothetical protein